VDEKGDTIDSEIVQNSRTRACGKRCVMNMSKDARKKTIARESGNNVVIYGPYIARGRGTLQRNKLKADKIFVAVPFC